MKKKKTEEEILNEAAKRFKQILEYTYMGSNSLLSEEGDEDDDDNNAQQPTAGGPNNNATAPGPEGNNAPAGPDNSSMPGGNPPASSDNNNPNGQPQQGGDNNAPMPNFDNQDTTPEMGGDDDIEDVDAGDGDEDTEYVDVEELTDREIRKSNNLEKMYLNGAFTKPRKLNSTASKIINIVKNNADNKKIEKDITNIIANSDFLPLGAFLRKLTGNPWVRMLELKNGQCKPLSTHFGWLESIKK